MGVINRAECKELQYYLPKFATTSRTTETRIDSRQAQTFMYGSDICNSFSMPSCVNAHQENNVKAIQHLVPTMGKTQLAVPDDAFCVNVAAYHA